MSQPQTATLLTQLQQDHQLLASQLVDVAGQVGRSLGVLSSGCPHNGWAAAHAAQLLAAQLLMVCVCAG